MLVDRRHFVTAGPAVAIGALTVAACAPGLTVPIIPHDSDTVFAYADSIIDSFEAVVNGIASTGFAPETVAEARAIIAEARAAVATAKKDLGTGLWKSLADTVLTLLSGIQLSNGPSAVQGGKGAQPVLTMTIRKL